jgi:hypothetical protein
MVEKEMRNFPTRPSSGMRNAVPGCEWSWMRSYAHLHELTKEELECILGDFPYCEEEGYREVWELQDEGDDFEVL